MGRTVLIRGGAGLLVVLVLLYAGFALMETERTVLRATEAEGRALLSVVSVGVERSLLASRAVEELLADRLLGLSRLLSEEIEASPGREEAILRAFVSRERLKGAVLLDAAFTVTVSLGPQSGVGLPLGGATSGSRRLTPLIAEDLVRRARAAGLGERESVAVGFGESPFSAQVEFLVGLALPESGGYLLLRLDADPLRGLREQAGVNRLIQASAESPAIAYLLLQDGSGKVLAASDPSRVGESLAPGEEAAAWQHLDGRRVLDVAVPAAWPGHSGGFLRVGLEEGPVKEVLRRGRINVLLFTGLALLVGAVGAAALARLARSAARKQAAMTEELRTREQAAVLGRMAGAVAHEVRSPLNAISMAAQRLQRSAPEGDESREILDAMRREVGRLNLTVEEFLDLARERVLSPTEIDLPQLVRDVVAAEAPEATILPPERPVLLTADAEEIRRALGNLVRNAKQAAGESKVVVAWRKDGGNVILEVRDGGPGVKREDRERIFLHFVTKRAGGTGLGLAIALSVARRHGGDLSVDDAPEGGARFKMRLPDGGSR
jgi:signal transduction histidine kinase